MADSKGATYQNNYNLMLKKVKIMFGLLNDRINADVKSEGYRQYMICTALKKFNESGLANSEFYVGEFTLERVIKDFEFCHPNVMPAEQVVFYKYMLEDMATTWMKQIAEFTQSLAQKQ